MCRVAVACERASRSNTARGATLCSGICGWACSGRSRDCVLERRIQSRPHAASCAPCEPCTPRWSTRDGRPGTPPTCRARGGEEGQQDGPRWCGVQSVAQNGKNKTYIDLRRSSAADAGMD
ncbi:hypothetical protein BD413DRAFT_3649 [Trametes elegans]|nr:hypothetical protein BD413DRAFT_3649 [Trametes elegans]